MTTKSSVFESPEDAVTPQEKKEHERHTRRFRAKTSKLKDDELLELVASLDVHPVCNALPAMAADEFADLVRSIGQAGLQEPVVFWDGRLVDGRHRIKACMEAKAKLKGVMLHSCSEAQMIEWVLGKHLGRRNLTDSQRAILMADMMIERVKASRRRKGKERIVSVGEVAAAEDPAEDPAEDSESEAGGDEPTLDRMPSRPEELPMTAAEAAKAGNVSQRTLERAVKTRLSGDASLNAEVDSGNLALGLSDRLARLPKDRQREFVEILKAERAKDPSVKAAQIAKDFLARAEAAGDAKGKPAVSVTLTFRTTDARYFGEDGTPDKETLNGEMKAIAAAVEAAGFADIRFAVKTSR